MKTLMALLVMLSGIGYATTVTLNESVSMKVEPDMMRTTLSFEERSKHEQSIRSHFNTLVKSVKRMNNSEGLECSGGSYRISPQYSWSNNRQNFLGYQGSVSFSCEFDNIDAFNRLSEELDTVSQAYKNVKRRQGTLNWAVSDERSVQNRETLERALIQRLERKGDHLSDAMGQTCQLKTIHFQGSSRPQPIREMMMSDRMAKSASVPIEQPIQSDATLSLGARAEYECQ